MKRFAIVGAGQRCYTVFVDEMYKKYSNYGKICGVYDVNKVRSEFFKKKIGDDCTIYYDFDKMLDTEKPDVVVVTTTDSTHHEYIVKALDKGYDVITEKPITNTFEGCLEIRNAEKRSGKKVTVGFNCRFAPYFAKTKELLMSGIIGKPLSISYEYCLNRVHGGDYFKRWHRLYENSQGMFLHKCTHHFDLINWFLDDEPLKVTALANSVFYADKNKAFGERCSTCTKKHLCESSITQTGYLDEELYFNAEGEDGYIRDRCSYMPDSDIYDNMSVSVMYTKGAILSYSLTMFAEHEGYKISITGDKGTLIINEWEEDNKTQDVIEVLNKQGEKKELCFDRPEGTHWGADERLLAGIFGLVDSDKLNQHASSFEGIVSAMVGICANISVKEERTVNVQDYINKLR